MILEVARLDVRPGQEAVFEDAMRAARPLIAASPGFGSLELRRCLDATHRYLLQVTWQSLEDHTVGFRRSERYADWRRLLHHFYNPLPTVEHFGEPVDLLVPKSRRLT